MRQALPVALALIVACGGSDPLTGPDPVSTSTAHLSGIVVETSSTLGERPVGGAIVEVASVRTTTTADGSYSLDIAHVPVGTLVTIIVWRGNAPVARREITLAWETRADFLIAGAPLSSTSGSAPR